MDRFKPHNSGIWIGNTYYHKDWKWAEWKDTRTREQVIKEVQEALEALKN